MLWTKPPACEGDAQACRLGSRGPSVLEHKSHAHLEGESTICRVWDLMKSARPCIHLAKTGPLAVTFPLKRDYKSSKMELLKHRFYVT